jgi:PKD repeat protein
MNKFIISFRIVVQIAIAASLLTHKGMAQQDTLFTESFESAAIGQTPPAGWAVDPISGSDLIWFVSSGTMPTCSPYDGNRMVEFRGYNNGNNLQNRLRRTIPVSTIGYNVVSMDFRLYVDTLPSSQWNQIDVEWSTDGINWDELMELYDSGPHNEWVYESIASIPGAGQQSTVYISFLFTTIDPISMNCHLDFIHIFGQYITPPTVTTGSATNIDQTHATLHGIINPNGVNSYWSFEYEPTSPPWTGGNTGGGWVSGNSDIPVSVSITDLTPGTTYHYHIYGTDGITAVGADSTFTTSSAPDSTWLYVGHRSATDGQSSETDIVFDSTGHPCVAFEDLGKTSVMRFDGSAWSYMGSRDFSSGTVYDPSLAFSSSGGAYVGYGDDSCSGKEVVKKYTGSTWVNVGTPGFSAGATIWNSLAFGSDGLPCVGYLNTSGSPVGISVMKFDGSNWNYVGSPGISGQNVSKFGGLKVSPSGQLYVAYGWATGSVKKFDGTNWVFVGNEGFIGEQPSGMSMAFSPAGTLYVAIYGDSTTTQQTRFKISVYKFDGTSWSLVGKHGFARGWISQTALAISPEGEPYVTFMDVDNDEYTSVMKFNGVRWVYVGNKAFSQGSTGLSSIAFNPAGLPYVAYDEENTFPGFSVMVHPADTIACNHADFVAWPDSVNPYTFHFLDQSYGDVGSWYWNFGDGDTSTVENPVHIYPSGYVPYDVCLEVDSRDGSCSNVYCDTVLPGAVGCQAIFAEYPDTLHEYGVHFQDHSVWGVDQWLWDFGDGTTSTLKNPDHIYSHGGSWQVCLTIHTTPAYACSTTGCRDIYVSNAVRCTSNFTYFVNEYQASFIGYMNSNQIAGYSWNFGDGSLGQGMITSHLYADTGTFNVVLTTVTTDGCTYSSSQAVRITGTSGLHELYGQVFAGSFPMTSGFALLFSLDTIPPYNPFIELSTCDTNGVYYFTLVPDGNYYFYSIPIEPSGYLPTFYGNVLHWEDATIIHLGQPANPYNINLIRAHTSISGNGNIQGTISITGLKSSMISDIMVLLEDAGGNTISYYNVSSQGDFVFPSLAYGTYYLKAELAGVTSDLIMVVLSPANPQATVQMTFTGNNIYGFGNLTKGINSCIIYPNPVNDNVHISLNSTDRITVDFEIISITGTTVLQLTKNLSAGNNLIILPTNSLNSGIYSLRITSNEGFNVTRKLVKI